MSSEAGNKAGSDLARLIRSSVDGELTREEEQALLAHLEREPGDAARVEFERELKSAVGRSMRGAYAAPPGLRDRVQAAISGEEAARPQPVVEVMAARTRERSFWRGTAGRLVAAAAVIAIAFGTWTVFRPGLQGQVFTEPEGRVQLAGFLTREHRFCDEDKDFAARKLICRDPARLSENCEQWIGTSVPLAQLFEGPVRLVGMGPCAVPGRGRSVHMQMELQQVGDPSQAMASLFIQEGSAGEELRTSEVYRLDEGGDGVTITVWRDETTNLVFYLVCEGQEGTETAREVLGVAPPTQSL